MITLIKKNLPYTVGQTDADTEGRRLTVTLNPIETLLTKSITITNPNVQQREFFKSLTDWFLTYPITKHLIGGDFNATFSDLEDRKHTIPTKSIRCMRILHQHKSKQQYSRNSHAIHASLTPGGPHTHMTANILTSPMPSKASQGLTTLWSL